MTKSIVSQDVIQQKIILVRGKKVMLDRDLAKMYGVGTKVLNQAVKRNKKRFPKDFMFQLKDSEKDELVTNCDRFKSLKHSTVNPYVFTEQGVAMLSTVLNSEQAIQVNILIIRTFVKMREIISINKGLIFKLDKLESKVQKHDESIRAIFEAIRQLLKEEQKPKKTIGFHNR